jgi:RND superfamily putative drug exporter
MLGRLAHGVVRRRWWIAFACVAAAAISTVGGRGLFARLGYSLFYDPAAESTRAAALARAKLGESDPDVVALYRLPPEVAPGDGWKDPGVKQALARTLDRVASDGAVAHTVSALGAAGSRLLSSDGRSTFVVLSLRGDGRAKSQAVPRLRSLLAVELPSRVLKPSLTGLFPTGRSLRRLAEQSLARGERFALPVTALLLVLIFGSVVAALLPLAIGALGILFTLGALDLLSRLVGVDAFTVNVVTILGLGVAIDYALFVVSRYREELVLRPSLSPDPESERGARERALVRALETAGRAVLFSGVTVAVSLAGLFAFRLPFLRSVAVGGMVVVLLAAALALVVLPAMLAILGPRLERGRLLHRQLIQPDAQRDRFWRRLCVEVLRQPLLVCAFVTTFLLTLAIPFGRLQPARADVRALPSGEEPRRVSEQLQRDFPATTLTPVSLLVEMDDDVLDGDRLGRLYDYVERLRAVPGVTRVETLLYFAKVRDRAEAVALGPALSNLLESPAGARRAAGIGSILNGRYTLVRVISPAPPDSREAWRLVERVRTLAPPPSSRVMVYGPAAAEVDFSAGLRARIPWMLAIIASAMFVVLLIAFDSLILPLKAMAMTALSLTASFGAIVFVFQDGRLERWLGYESLGTIDATLPVVMFAVVFGLSMDYEVLILGRVREAWLRTGRNREAIVEGISQTGPLVTSAALLMVVVFSAFSAAPVLYVKALGLGMGLAVALDATVVRMLLVPSTMALLGRLNWWRPKWTLFKTRHLRER